MRKNIFAYTEPTGHAPSYVSVNTVDAGKLELSVRGPAFTSQEGYIVLSDDQAGRMAVAIIKHLKSKKANP